MPAWHSRAVENVTEPRDGSQGGRVLVTGATGRIGGAVVERLTGSGIAVRALTRQHPDAVTLPAGVDIVRGDLTDPGSLDDALRDVDVVFLVWTAAPGAAPAAIERIAASSRRIVLLSSPHRTPHPFFQQPNPGAALHAELERLVAESRAEITVVRPGMFSSNSIFWWAPSIRGDGLVRWPYALAQTAPVADGDVAAVVAATLLDDGHAGGDYVLTGPQSLTQADQVAIIGEVVGRRAVMQELSPEAFRRATAGTWPPFVVEMLLDAWSVAVDRPAYVSTDVADVLGRPAQPFRAWVGDHIDAFTDGHAVGRAGI